MGRLPAFVVCMVLGVCVTATNARAEEDPKKMFEAATAEFNLGHYVKAAAMYEDIYKITLQPVLLYNIGQAHRLAGDLEKASFFYKGYLRAQPQARNHTEVEKRIVELDLAIAAKKRTQERPPNAPATVDARKPHVASTTPEPSTQPRTSPPRPINTEPAPSQPPPPQPTETPPPPADQPTTATTPADTTNAQAANAAPSSDKPVWKKWWFWTIIGGVVVVGVVVAVAVVATQAPTFNATLPETGPGARALTASPWSASSSHAGGAQTLKVLEVQF